MTPDETVRKAAAYLRAQAVDEDTRRELLEAFGREEALRLLLSRGQLLALLTFGSEAECNPAHAEPPQGDFLCGRTHDLGSEPCCSE